LFGLYKPGVLVKVFIPAKYILKQIPMHISDSSRNKEEEEEQDSIVDLMKQPTIGEMMERGEPVRHCIYGTDIYTDTSDIIGVCQHVGKLRINEIQKLNHVLKGILVGVRIHKPLRKYHATFRNNIRSRSWVSSVSDENSTGDAAESNVNSNSYSIETFKIIQDSIMPVHHHIEPADNMIVGWMNNSTDVEQFRFLPNVTIVFNFSGEPALKYSLNAIADKGHNKQQFTSMRLGREVLLLECGSNKYELSCHKKNGSVVFRWAMLSEKLKYASVSELKKLELPLLQKNTKNEQQITIIENELKWSDIQWGADSISILNGKHYYVNVKSIQFFKRTNALDSPQETQIKRSS
jgi:hypothetical protein